METEERQRGGEADTQRQGQQQADKIIIELGFFSKKGIKTRYRKIPH